MNELIKDFLNSKDFCIEGFWVTILKYNNGMSNSKLAIFLRFIYKYKINANDFDNNSFEHQSYGDIFQSVDEFVSLNKTDPEIASNCFNHMALFGVLITIAMDFQEFINTRKDIP